MDKVDFYKMAMRPDFPDMMQFQLTAPDMDNERTFSIEGMEAIAEQLKNFILARIVAYHDSKGDIVKEMTATLSVTFNGAKDLHNGELPFFTAEDMGEFIQLDGLRRFPGSLDN